MFAAPYIDIDEWRDVPVRHRYVHGGFEGTETRFSFYFPPEDQYAGRFFQHVTPVPDSENLAPGATGEDDKIGFSISSGAYFIETNGGGASMTGAPGRNVDPTVAAYRANAAAAQYSRAVAQEMYGPGRTYGYLYGGSGGGFRTMGAVENTEGVWDGAVPYVIGSPMAIPNVFTVRMHALRVLWEKFPQIVDALEPGGSGDMYAGLDDEERAALEEVTRMGFPPPAWFGYETMGTHAFTLLFGGVRLADPAYFEDFWSEPGYLGSTPPPSLLEARVQHETTVVEPVTGSAAAKRGLSASQPPAQVRRGVDDSWESLADGEGGEAPVGFRLEQVPEGRDYTLADLFVTSGAGEGARLSVDRVAGDIVLVTGPDPGVLAKIAPGDGVRIDNSDFLASQTYHRHQVPSPDFYVWDQFRDADGAPLYPQRAMLLGPLFAQAASGTVQTGRFHGKMIVVEALWDREAFPWQADWYRAKVAEALGAAHEDHFRLWYVDRALHGDTSEQEDPTRTVSYLGVLHQALRDLSRWVEEGVPPPASTAYEIVDGQVVVPATAAERRGVQPIVDLEVNGGLRAEVAVGETVAFTGSIAAPLGTGAIVAAEWDFDGTGTFAVKADLPAADHGEAEVSATHRFDRPGTYFPVLRAFSQRTGDEETPYARIANLARVRVVVEARKDDT